MKEKDTLRCEMRAILKSTPQAEIAAASKVICQQLHTHPELYGNAESITTFSARADEVSLSTLHQLLPDKKFLYPLCHRGGILSFHHVLDPTELTPGMLGILEPVPGKHTVVPTEEIDLFLCPGLVFGKDGSRLGHGGGFYDRALALRKPSSNVIGVGLDIQLRETVPNDEHDVFLEKLITENGVITF